MRVLTTAEGIAIDILTKLLVPVADETTSDSDGGGHVGLVGPRFTHAEFRAFETVCAGLRRLETGANPVEPAVSRPTK